MARSLIASSALVCALAAAGCSNGSEGEVKLGVDVAAIGDVIVEPGSGGSSGSSDLVLSRVRVLVATAKVGYINDQATGPSAEIGPYVIDLTADEIANGAHREFSLGTLESGTYGGAEIEIEPLEADDSPSGDEFADFLSTGASVLVDGTYQGAAFQFAGHFLAEQGTDGDVEIDASTPVTLALTVDASSWFKDAAGALQDPTDSAQHDTLAVAICETLDTQQQSGGPAGSGASPDGSGAPPADSSAPPAGSGAPPGDKGHGAGDKGGGKGGGGKEHCIEAAP